MKHEFICRECERRIVVEDELTNLEKVMLEEELCYCCATDIYVYCGCCKEIVRIEDTQEVYDCNDDIWKNICDDCIDREVDVFYCEEHERTEIDENIRYVENIGYVCNDGFYWGDYFTCPTCHDHHHIDNGYWEDDTEDYYCYDCYEEIMSNRVICRYHYHNDEYEYHKRHIGDEEKIYFGMELEVEDIYSNLSLEDMAKILSSVTDDFVYEHDGSLEEGFEIISYPFTKEYMKQNLQYSLVDMLNKLKINKYGSTERCGLHFHMSKVNWKTTMKMIGLMEYYRDELIKLSKRNRSKIGRWCSFYTNLSKDRLKEIELRGLEIVVDDDNSRYKALNIMNEDTIEVRLFTSTTNFDELMARFELVNNMYKWAIKNELETDFSNIPSFYELATYDENNFIGNYLQNNFPSLCGTEKATM